MSLHGPVIIIEDDTDDQEMLKEVFDDLGYPNHLHFFTTCLDARDYLMSTLEKPLIIISDINLPAMTGMQLRQEINNNDFLRRKSIPFVFLSTNPDKRIVQQAYELLVQGYFIKPPRMGELREMIKMIVEYWTVCKHPNME